MYFEGCFAGQRRAAAAKNNTVSFVESIGLPANYASRMLLSSTHGLTSAIHIPDLPMRVHAASGMQQTAPE